MCPDHGKLPPSLSRKVPDCQGLFSAIPEAGENKASCGRVLGVVAMNGESACGDRCQQGRPLQKPSRPWQPCPCLTERPVWDTGDGGRCAAPGQGNRVLCSAAAGRKTTLVETTDQVVGRVKGEGHRGARAQKERQRQKRQTLLFLCMTVDISVYAYGWIWGCKGPSCNPHSLCASSQGLLCAPRVSVGPCGYWFLISPAGTGGQCPSAAPCREHEEGQEGRGAQL